MIGLGDAIQVDSIAVQIAIIAEHVERCRSVFAQCRRIIHRHRNIIGRIDGQIDASGIRASGAVGNRIGERVGAVVIGVRRIGDGAVGVENHAAVIRLGNFGHAQGVAISIGIVGQHIDGNRSILVQGRRIIGGIWIDIDADARRGGRGRRVQVAGFRRGRGNRQVEVIGNRRIQGQLQAIQLIRRQRPRPVRIQRAGGQGSAARQSGHFEGQGFRAVGIGQSGLDIQIIDRFHAFAGIGIVVIVAAFALMPATAVAAIVIAAAAGRLGDQSEVNRYRRRIGNRFDINRGGRRRDIAGFVCHGVVETGVAAEIGVRREHDIAVDNLDGAADRAIDRRDLQHVALDIGVVGEQGFGIDDHGDIFDTGHRIIHRNRRVIFRVHGQVHGRRIGSAGAIADRISEAVGAVIIGVRRIGDSAVLVDGDQTVLRLGDVIEAYGATIQVCIVG